MPSFAQLSHLWEVAGGKTAIFPLHHIPFEIIERREYSKPVPVELGPIKETRSLLY